ncbi:hypothetical protein NliqN6_6160 [Naganishia liquefaciens]|uniref:Ketoreductase domain-containing protein n=1 Tax=Naganishia liquefaciens TaxID=104408 RepID=A0A8H3TZ70_9TREE|nr:hypothetical protein NliqN6_6160 [Naganishia liquefaciens]
MSSPVVILTGASKGLGLSIANILLQVYSAKLVAVSRSVPEGLQKLVESNEGSVELVTGDVRDQETSERACQVALQKFGRLDGLVLNAGTLDPLGPVVTTDIKDWQAAFNVNFFSLVTMLQATTPALRESKGKIVFVSSGAATGDTQGWAAYNSTKAAMNSLSRTFAKEEKEISSFAVRPGVVDTEMQAKLRELGPKAMNAAEFERFSTMHKEGKLLPPDSPGYVIASLAVKGPHQLSGQFLNWNADELADYQNPAQ